MNKMTPHPVPQGVCQWDPHFEPDKNKKGKKPYKTS